MAYIGNRNSTQFVQTRSQRLSGNNTTKIFGLQHPVANSVGIEVFVENVRQDPHSSYTASNRRLTFTTAPPSGTDNVYVVYSSMTLGSTEPTPGSTFKAGQGSVSIPSITRGEDQNTGFFFPAADTVAGTAGGTEQIRFTKGLVNTKTAFSAPKITANTFGKIATTGPFTAPLVTANSFTKIVTKGPITSPILTSNTVTVKTVSAGAAIGNKQITVSSNTLFSGAKNNFAKKVTANSVGTNILTTQGPITTPKVTANNITSAVTLNTKKIVATGPVTAPFVTANNLSSTVINATSANFTLLQADTIDFDGDVTVDQVTANSVVTSTVVSNGGVTVDNITIDGTEIDLSSGDLTIDVAGDIILDADGADVKLSDGGTNFLTFTKSSDNVSINTPISDGDISFVGNDGGSSVTAMTFDMSAGGAVTIDPNGVLGTASGANAKLNVGTLSGTAAALNVNVAGSDGAGAYRLINATDGVTTNFVVKTDNSASANKVMLGPETSSNLVLYIGAGEHIVIDSSGHVTKPNNTAFSVHKNGTDESNLGINSNHKMQWSTERFDVNSDFDIGNNQFVAPVTGKYFLSCTARAEQMDVSASYVLWTLVTSNQTYHTIHDPARDLTADSSLGPTLHVSLVVDMDANDTAYVQFNQTGGAAQQEIDGDAQFTYFSGFLIG